MKLLLSIGAWLMGLGMGFGLCLLIFRPGNVQIINLSKNEVKKEYPLLKYRVENLRNRAPQGENLRLVDKVATESGYGVYKFSFITEKKYATGLAHIPDGCSVESRCPVIVQNRGYVAKELYYSGAGTQRSAIEYAKAGFISLAADYLGFGESASPSGDIFEERFEKYTTVLDLLSLIKDLPMADENRIGLWGHSNGGQVTLTVLEASGESHPTVLWAPVSVSFPYSVLYYTDEDRDGGKAFRKELARFESDYDTEEFTVINYLDFINASIQLHQGGSDELVPLKWSRQLETKLEALGKQVDYFEYPLADHNMRPDWNLVVARDIEFFRKYFDKEVD